jgi:hypothetical protein
MPHNKKEAVDKYCCNPKPCCKDLGIQIGKMANFLKAVKEKEGVCHVETPNNDGGKELGLKFYTKARRLS